MFTGEGGAIMMTQEEPEKRDATETEADHDRSPQRDQLRRMVNSDEVRQRISKRLDPGAPAGQGKARVGVQGLLPGLGVRLEQVQAALLSADSAFINQLSDAMLRQDITYAQFYSDMIRPIAGALGDGWRDDRLNIVDIEMASSRLALWCDKYADGVLRSKAPTLAQPKRIVLAHMPGEQHTLGISIISHVFREAGWEVEGGPGLAFGSELDERVARAPYDVVGLSLGKPVSVAKCRAMIDGLRERSRNRDVLIGIGGPVVAAEPSAYRASGCDFIAADALEAVDACRQLTARA